MGTLGRDLDRVFQKKVCGTWVSTGSNRDDTQFNKDVEKFVRLYRDANLCSKVPGREHSAFPGFEYSYHIRNPGKLKQRLKKYSAKLDLSRRILPY